MLVLLLQQERQILFRVVMAKPEPLELTEQQFTTNKALIRVLISDIAVIFLNILNTIDILNSQISLVSTLIKTCQGCQPSKWLLRGISKLPSHCCNI